MIQVEELVKQAKKLKGCREGVKQLKNSKTIQELINCLYDNIDYCIAKRFPSKEELLRIDANIRRASGVFVDDHVTIDNPKRLFLIDSKVDVRFNSYNVCRAYVTGNSELNINSSGRAITMIDALGDSKVKAIVNEPSQVSVYLYGNAKSEGASKTTVKDQETYEL